MAAGLWQTKNAWNWLALILAPLLIFAQPAQSESLEEALAKDTADGELDDHDFIKAALICGGVDEACELAQWADRYADLRSAALATAGGDSLRDRLQAIQCGLQKNILVGRYVATASDLRTTIARGDYNCLTALAIQWDLCQSAGLSLEICARPGHVNLRLAPGMELEPGAARPFAAAFFSSASGRCLTPVELLGKFYYNRGVAELQEGNFAVGLAHLKTSLRLDPADRDARENLVAGFNNWAVAHCRAGRYDLAAPLIANGLAIEPSFPPLVANERLVRENGRP